MNRAARRTVSGLIWLVLILLGAGTGMAEPRLLSARLVAEIVGQTDLAVDLFLELRPGEAQHLPVAILLVESAAVTGILAHSDTGGEPAALPPVTMRDGGSDLWTGHLELPPGASRLRLRYLVEDAVEHHGKRFTLILPVLAPQWQPVEGAAIFSVELKLPPEAHLIEAFPTDLHPGQADRTILRGALPVVPSFLRVEARTGSRPWITVGRLVDLSTVALLAVLLTIALSRLRELAR